MIRTTGLKRKSLTLGVSSAALLVALAGPAFAQTAPATTQETPAPGDAQTPGNVALKDQNSQDTALSSSKDQAQADGGDVVVTGTLFRGTAQTPSPVTTLTAANLEQRGINTVTEAIQRLSANGAGTLPNSFSANGAFAAGASAPSLRGLTTDSTLVLFDGLRAAYYPLADDGVRNFVDINQIPDAIVDRIEVLKDGASSTYGADAVAGVVNIITKKQITGVHLNGSAGISERGDSAEQRLDATVGYGDLSENHFNFYVSGEYQKDAILYNRDRGYPYNTSDLSGLCAPSVGTATIPAGTTTCRSNGVLNGIQADGTYAGFAATINPTVRPYNATNTAALSRYTLLNPAQGCGVLPTVTLNAAQAAANTAAAITNCQQDNRNLYSVITPAQERIGGSARLTVQLGEKTQAYVSGNFYQSDVFYTGVPASVRTTSANGGGLYNGALPTTTTLALPVFVCPLNGANATYPNSVPTAPGGCTAANGTLNPNNPYAALGETARIYSYLQGIPLSNERRSRSYRAAAGLNGSAGSLFDYSVEGTYNREDLRATYNGYINLQRLINVVADGSYNFVNQAANSQAERNYLAPSFVVNSKSELAQVQITLRKELFNLPGGPLGIAAGGAFRYEEIYAPSANPVDTADAFDTTNINRFGTSGARGVASGFFEINVPLFNQFLLNGSGRYDSYSSGQTNFSPKIGGKFTPIKQISFVSTFSKGFRIPSFAEAYGLPTTGFSTFTPPASYQNSAACTIPGTVPAAKYAYCTNTYSVGVTSVGNPNLKPEKATNFTAGVILNPTNNISLRVDYYNIYKKDLIIAATPGDQVSLYYASNGSGALASGVQGITVDNVNYIPGQGPYPLLATLTSAFFNANSAKSTGIDFDLESSYNITPGVKWISSLDANYVLELSTTINGVKQNYVNSLGPYQTTSASGTPRWRGSWQNTFDFGKLALTGTAYYTSGYSEGAADAGNTPDGQTCYSSTAAAGTPASNIGSFAVYRDGATVVACRVKHFIDVDVTATAKVNDNFTLYFNVLNVLNVSAPYDPSTYGASNYNPAWANAGIIGRYFRMGARVKF
ncbi:TonB-dependent receptor domain-containing protein [uncultured Sphingomonas sp.]|uniref:TonB-dependent receptor domain-containing protein n=1 Tax=uncultured Sphingomonas sp. TaxID=158754 RepID=UPI0035CB0C87